MELKWLPEIVDNFLARTNSKNYFCEIITYANSMTDFNQIIYHRRSIRKFKNQPVEKEKIEWLLKAVLLAPSGKGMYPCEYIVIDDPHLLQIVSQSKQHGAELIKNAPLAIAVVADSAIYDIWVEDASIAATFIMLEAENLGLGCCWVQMRKRGTDDGKSATQNLKEILGLKDTHEILSVMAIGYKDEEKRAYTDADLKMKKIHHNRIHNKL
jgi:nitroreductase